MTFRAPRELVFEQLSAPSPRQTPKAPQDTLEVQVRGADLVVAANHSELGVAANHSDLGWYGATTVEAVGFGPPRRITFRRLRGPVPHTVEEFVLDVIDDDHTRLT